MPIRRRRPRVLLAAVLAAFACEVEETSTLDVAVRVEPPVHASSFPAQILVAFDAGGSGVVVFRIGFLCAPDAPFFTTAAFPMPRRGDGPTEVDAFLVPVGPGVPVACGPLATPQSVSSAPAPGATRTTASVEVLAVCGTGEVRSATVVFARSQ